MVDWDIMSRVLILDDDENRHRLFRRMFARDLLVHVYTASQAIRALRDLPAFDLVCLDHDLYLSDGLIGVGDPGDGMIVSRFIAEDLGTGKRPGHIWIHSHNVFRRGGMAKILKEAGLSIEVDPFPI